LVTDAQLEVLSPLGVCALFARKTAPVGWLPCDGAALSRVTYDKLYAALVTSKGTVTVTIASPAVFTRAAHGLQVGDAIFLETTGALPTGLTADTTYYVISAGLTADNFEVSTTRGGAAVNTSGTQSGTHTLFDAPWGVSAATTFLVPDLRGRTAMGYAASGGHIDASVFAKDEGVALAFRTLKHKHSIVLNMTDPGHTHNLVYGINAGSATQPGGAGADPSSKATNSGTTGITFAPTVGPQTGEPNEFPAHAVLLWMIRATYS
jgi:microcystin-dependent protein